LNIKRDQFSWDNNNNINKENEALQKVVFTLKVCLDIAYYAEN